MKYNQDPFGMLSEYFGRDIPFDDVTTESTILETEELDPTLIPDEYQRTIENCEAVMTHLFAYQHMIAFIIEPDDSSMDQLVGLLNEDQLIRYKIIKGGS